MNQRAQKASFLFILTVVVWTAFSPCLKAGFLNWDDDINIVENISIRSISPLAIVRMFQETAQKIYTPLTTLSYAIEYHFFGLKPFIYHFDNFFCIGSIRYG